MRKARASRQTVAWLRRVVFANPPIGPLRNDDLVNSLRLFHDLRTVLRNERLQLRLTMRDKKVQSDFSSVSKSKSTPVTITVWMSKPQESLLRSTILGVTESPAAGMASLCPMTLSRSFSIMQCVDASSCGGSTSPSGITRLSLVTCDLVKGRAYETTIEHDSARATGVESAALALKTSIQLSASSKEAREYV